MMKKSYLTTNAFSYIPLKGNTKVPAIDNWQKCCDELSSFPLDVLMKNNVAVATGKASNALVVDIDNARVFESFLRRNRLTIERDYVVKTGKKGEHVYFQYPDDGKEYRSKSYAVYGFDIRGTGGCVVAPHSIHPDTGEEYKIVEFGDIPEAPEWLKEYCSKKIPSAKPNIDKIHNKKIRDLIVKGTEQGERSEAMMQVITSMVRTGFTDDQLFYVFNVYKIGEKYLEKAEHTREPWLQDQIDKARELIGDAEPVEQQSQSSGQMPKITIITACQLEEKVCKVEWIVEGLIEKSGHTLITGKSGLGKSMFSLNLAYSLASATEQGFMGHQIVRPLKVMIIQCENNEPFMQQRIISLRKLNPAYTVGRPNVQFTYFDDRHDNPIFKLSNANLDEMIDSIYNQSKPDVIILDPYKSYSGVQENDNDRNRDILDNYYYILGKYGITSILIHHEGKANEYTGTARSRGASTITDTVSNHWTITRRKEPISGIDQLVVGCAKARNYKKFDDIYMETIDGVYYKMIDDPNSPDKLINLLIFNGGSIETQGEFIKLIQSQMGVSNNKARAMIMDAVNQKLIKLEEYGQRKHRYYVNNVEDFAA